jgi:hypothetical protein
VTKLISQAKVKSIINMIATRALYTMVNMIFLLITWQTIDYKEQCTYTLELHHFSKRVTIHNETVHGVIYRPPIGDELDPRHKMTRFHTDNNDDEISS